MSNIAVGRLRLTFEKIEADGAQKVQMEGKGLSVLNIAKGGGQVYLPTYDRPILIGHNGIYVAATNDLRRLYDMIDVLQLNSAEMWLVLSFANATEAGSFIAGVSAHASPCTKNFWTTHRVDFSPFLQAERMSQRAVLIHF